MYKVAKSSGRRYGIVGQSTLLAAALDVVAEGPFRLIDVARRIHVSAAEASRYLARLGDAVQRDPTGRFAMADLAFAAWVRWRRPGGSVTSMKTLGDEGEARAADALARLGFDLVYQSRASRGAFDLLATRGATQLGVQVKRSAVPLRFSKSEWARMHADAARFGWRWLIAAVTPDAEVLLLDPAGAAVGREIRLGREAQIPRVLAWLDERRASATKPRKLRSAKAISARQGSRRP